MIRAWAASLSRDENGTAADLEVDAAPRHRIRRPIAPPGLPVIPRADSDDP